jgi:hypothetical protein
MTRLPPALCAAVLAVLATAAPAQASDAAPCARHLEKNHTYHANQAAFTTDGAGRPIQALTGKLADKAAERTSCEAAVGDWGGRSDWQGGHLIASAFWGVSKRYNLVPMRGRQINQGLMLRVENGARACLDAGAVADYRVQVHYPDATTIVPDRIHVSMSATISGVSRQVTLTFPNTGLRPRELRGWQTKITAAFRSAHCTTGTDKA